VYNFHTYKTNLSAEDQHAISEVTLVSAIEDSTITQGAERGAAVGRGVILARDLANRPSNDMTPAHLADVARALSEQFGMALTVLEHDELRAQGFGGLLGVGQGSAQTPRFIAIEHGAGLTNVPTVCLVGKGITFDSGGISIKPSERMEDMKMDMSGAAAVLGTMQVVSELNLPIHVVGLISAAENMPSSSAYKPGDVLTTLSGKTIEVINTDAEGRIVLADALFYAQRYQPHGIIDLATLTGAVQVALGAFAIGLISNDDELAERILQAADASGEPAWRLPLWQPYKEMIKSDIADIKNSSGRYAGAITAGAFLSNFVGDIPWVHLDIAGAVMLEQKKAYLTKGGNGTGVRLLTQALCAWAEER
jgi:leucyl aminopeptidase